MILSTIKGRRVFQATGLKVAAAPTPDENSVVGADGRTEALTCRGENIAWEWMQWLHDWIDLETRDVLSRLRANPCVL